MKRLSLCMIVRNEERHIRRCLESMGNVADEIVVVDTGSTDRTVEICQSFGAEVHVFPWNDSFADARNYGLERAAGEWIIYLDADEELETGDRPKLKDAIISQEADLLAVRILNYSGKTPDLNDAYFIEQYRIFRKGLGLQFKQDIHEMLNVEETRQRLTAASLPITIHHYGYLEQAAELKRKHMRNLRILEKEMAKPEHSPWIEYHAASEYYRIGKYETALRYVNQAILMFLQAGTLPPSLLYKLKYEMLLSPDKAHQALATIDFAIQNVSRLC
ncbi:glycosyltransferase family 2 protein [Paenibacillus senegalensis]|uniref:glycosyltransferase family 2 protein n=1 Tax=Paenibacillus senegalensis TaxID=1465766 RepID=UPI000287ED5A|nr:glycosyltransferase family 2 protein [Paenibacillus senegalensis]